VQQVTLLQDAAAKMDKPPFNDYGLPQDCPRHDGRMLAADYKCSHTMHIQPAFLYECVCNVLLNAQRILNALAKLVQLPPPHIAAILALSTNAPSMFLFLRPA
jgi:hypothetical protein